MRPLVWEYKSKRPVPANIQIKSSAGHFFHSLLGCSWLHQIGNKSPASLYTSSERTVNEMWEISLCVRACERLSLCVRAQRISLTFQVFLGTSVTLENAESVLVGTKFWTWILPLCFSAVEHICWIGKCDGCPDLNVNPQLAPPPPTHTNNVLPASFAATLLSTTFAVFRAGRKAFGLA